MGVGCLSFVLAACGGSSSSAAPPASTPTSPGSSHSPTGPATPGAAAVSRAVTTTFTTFFSGKTPADRKISLVQNGQGFARVIRAQAGGAMSQATTVSVSRVKATSPTRADVRYTILLGGSPALKNQVGVAVKEHGHWVVGAATFCQLLTLEQSAPPLCKGLS